MDKLSLGKLGERIAASFLKKQGYKILEMNFRIRGGEIDIVAIENNTLVFVEVKTRREVDRISPEQSITFFKLDNLKKSALFYKSSRSGLPDELRIDFVGIEIGSDLKPKRINLIKNIYDNG